jgi:hypothetical protein
MRTRSSVILAAAAVSSLVLAATSDANAQTVIVQQQPVQPVQVQPVQPAYPPGYGPGYAPAAPQYTAPLYQEVQPSYVPQSVAMSGPRIIKDWNEGEPIPPGYHETTRIRKGLVIGGASIFGGMYLLTIIGASIADGTCTAVGANSSCNANALFAPVVGPFIQMTQCQGSCGLGDFWLGFDGVVQAAGVAMFIAGLAAPSTVLVRNDLGYEAPKPPKLALTPIPLVSPTMQGMGLLGRF